MSSKNTFLCSEVVLGFSGVALTLAGVAATEDGDVLSKVPAGIFTLLTHTSNRNEESVNQCPKFNQQVAMVAYPIFYVKTIHPYA